MRNGADNLHDHVGVLGIECDGNRIDIGKRFIKHRFGLQLGQCGQSTGIA